MTGLATVVAVTDRGGVRTPARWRMDTVVPVMEAGRVTARDVVLLDGDVRWLFPTLTDPAEQIRVRDVLQAADDAVYRLGQLLGAPADAQVRGIPLNRLVYQRLGPEPEFPVTVLMAEGGTGQILTDLFCAPPGPGPYRCSGPSWRVDATIALSCDVDPQSCSGHEIDTRFGPIVDTPAEAAAEVQAAAEWLLQRLAHETEQSLLAGDRRLRHRDPALP